MPQYVRVKVEAIIKREDLITVMGELGIKNTKSNEKKYIDIIKKHCTIKAGKGFISFEKLTREELQMLGFELE